MRCCSSARGAITSITGGAQLNETGAQSRVAIAGTPNSNSALTTLSSNAGQLMLNNGATVTTNPGTNPGTNLSNSNFVALDFFGNQGGSNLTVGGTLTNTSSGTVQVGTSGGSLSATSTLSAAGLSNSGTVDLFGNTSNSANQANLTVNGAASNAGTINIRTAGNLSVTSVGNAYAQTAGTTNIFSGGTLTAPNVNVTGGTLQATAPSPAISASALPGRSRRSRRTPTTPPP
jgi:hypothetical protein